MKSAEERFVFGSVFVAITFDKTKLIMLNKLRFQRKAKIPSRRTSKIIYTGATAQIMGGRV